MTSTNGIGIAITYSFYVLTVATMYWVSNAKCIEAKDSLLTMIVKTRLGILTFGFILTMLFNCLMFSYFFVNADLSIILISTCKYYMIVLLTFVIIGQFPAVVDNTFGNSIGMSVVKSLFNYESVRNVFTNTANKEIPTDYIIPEFNALMEKFDINYVKTIVGKFPGHTMEAKDFCTDSTSSTSDPNENLVKDLFKLCITKHNIGHMTWFLISAFFTITLSYQDYLHQCNNC